MLQISLSKHASLSCSFTFISASMYVVLGSRSHLIVGMAKHEHMLFVLYFSVAQGAQALHSRQAKRLVSPEGPATHTETH